MLVPGAITAKLAAAVMNVPAEPALAPLGETYTATGIGDSRSNWTMSLVAPRRPPGVSSWMTKSVALSSAACSMALETKRTFTELMIPSTFMTRAWGESGSCAWASTGPSMPRTIMLIKVNARDSRAMRMGLVS